MPISWPCLICFLPPHLCAPSRPENIAADVTKNAPKLAESQLRNRVAMPKSISWSWIPPEGDTYGHVSADFLAKMVRCRSMQERTRWRALAAWTCGIAWWVLQNLSSATYSPWLQRLMTHYTSGGSNKPNNRHGFSVVWLVHRYMCIYIYIYIYQQIILLIKCTCSFYVLSKMQCFL
jgi:hypothetical protein